MGQIVANSAGVPSRYDVDDKRERLLNGTPTQRVTVPATLLKKLAGYRRALLGRRLLESIGFVVCAALFAFWVLFGIDRLLPTGLVIRCVLLSTVICAAIWLSIRFLQLVFESRGSLNVARLIRRRDPVFGDHLVGALELAKSQTEQSRSATLCAGALQQVDRAAHADDRDLVLELHDALFVGP